MNYNINYISILLLIVLVVFFFLIIINIICITDFFLYKCYFYKNIDVYLFKKDIFYLFFILFFVFFIRSFVFESFRIPSSSMFPTLCIGDFIVVSKCSYGINLPIFNIKFFSYFNPNRGDVVVFRYPKDERMFYIKRIIGIPGDNISYHNKKIRINGVLVKYDLIYKSDISDINIVEESFHKNNHFIMNDLNNNLHLNKYYKLKNILYRNSIKYTKYGVTCIVPNNNYFLLGDNRDYSLDSRSWGFVPKNNIIGRAFFVWFNLKKIGDIGIIR